MHYFSHIHARELSSYAKKNKIPLFLTAHNVWDDEDFLSLTLDTGWDHIIAVSNYIKLELLGIGVPESKISVVHHGIDMEKFRNVKSDTILKKYPNLKNKRIILHPARLGLAKGCDVSIKALRLVKESVPNARLILTGTKNIIDWGTTQQKDIAYMLYLARKINLADDLFMRMIPLSVMPRFYNIADVCVYPSSSQEPFGITMLESMASGVPMVVTESGGMPEIIKDGVNGFVIKIKNFQQLAEKCLLLLNDEKLRRRLGENGKQLAARNYTKEIMTENITALYFRVLGDVNKKVLSFPGLQTVS